MSDLLKRLKKATAKQIESKTLNESDYFDYKKYGAFVDPIVFNLALGGRVLDPGLTPGVTILSGQSKSFKTLVGLHAVNAYLDRYEDAVCIFYDSELGATDDYWKSVGVDTSRVIHVVIQNIEHLKFDIQKKLNEIKDGEHVIFFIDSLGMLASKKEVLDSINENSAADMTRAKELKALFRQVTPHANELHIPIVAVNNNYASMDKYNPEAMGGGGGIVLAANTILWFRKSKHRDGGATGATDGDLAGFNFTITVFKSRFIKEGSKLPFRVVYGENGPNRYTGLYDLAIRTGDIYTPSKGWRAARIVDENGVHLPKEKHLKFRESDMFINPDFWEETMFKKTNFIRNIERRLALYYEGSADEPDFTNVIYDESQDASEYVDPETGEILDE